ncbi:hypothetical protein Dimus_024894, partial [Dionaea muscipula]
RGACRAANTRPTMGLPGLTTAEGDRAVNTGRDRRRQSRACSSVLVRKAAGSPAVVGSVTRLAVRACTWKDVNSGSSKILLPSSPTPTSMPGLGAGGHARYSPPGLPPQSSSQVVPLEARYLPPDSPLGFTPGDRPGLQARVPRPVAGSAARPVDRTLSLLLTLPDSPFSP